MDPWAQFPDANRAKADDAWDQFPDAVAAGATAQRAAPEALPPPQIAAPVEDTFGDKAIRTSAGVLGAPVDAVSSILELIGAPTSDAPFMGSKSIEGMMHSASGGGPFREARRPWSWTTGH
jgi:hypothetical protein